MPLSERDARQVSLLRRTLEASQSREISLPSLISNVEALIQEIEGIDETRRRALRGEWGGLEEVFALALYAQEHGDSYQEYVADHQHFIDASVANLLTMVAALESDEPPP